ncbi:MAG: hypothetical protein A7316_04760 [Candidatus Altiarchaeales archaeon WOR_SM1_86-2]|nr:MAG: hypothetical protein A7316_04760 [Candidatus Altiarchaeales archaeon WOR_SM1_86-2]
MNLKKELTSRIKKIRARMEEQKIDAFLVQKPKNLLYLAGMESGNMLLTPDEANLWVNELDYSNVNSSFKNYADFNIFPIRDYGKAKRIEAVGDYIKGLRPGNIGVENISFASYGKLKQELKSDLISGDIIEKTRQVKSEYEIGLLRNSAGIGKIGLEKAYEVVGGGISELDAVSEIEYAVRKAGSETPPFHEGALLASGSNAASIHAYASDKKIREGEMVVVDLGARYRGYYSDMTRTIPIGKLNKDERKVLEFVKNLKSETIDYIREGMKASDVHKFVEKRIKKLGYNFYHAAGHGIGLDVHELPSLGPDSDDVLKEGMVFTVEPGIYKAGKFGVRFEDMVVLTGKGCEVL